MMSIHSYGAEGEESAAHYLETKGLTILETRFHTRYGEIDLIARDGEDWVFVEVKARHREHDISAVDAITPAKQKRLVQSALIYMKRKHLTHESMRFDVVTLEAGHITWLRSAFEPTTYYTY